MEVPNEDTPFSVQFTALAPPNRYPLSVAIMVDGQKADLCMYSLRALTVDIQPHLPSPFPKVSLPKSLDTVISGMRIGTDVEGMMCIQLFVFHKTAAPGSHDDNNSGDDADEGEVNLDTATKNKAAGTIVLELYWARLRTVSKVSSTMAQGTPVTNGSSSAA